MSENLGNIFYTISAKNRKFKRKMKESEDKIGEFTDEVDKSKEELEEFSDQSKKASEDTEDLGDEATTTAAKMNTLQDETEEAADEVMELTTKLQLAGAALTGFAAAAGGVLAATTALAGGATYFANKIGKASEKANVTTESFQEMSYAFSQAGVAQEDTTEAMTELNNVMGEAVSGSDDARETLDKLGISLDQVRQGNISTEEAMMQTIDTLSSMENQQRKAALASEVFGEELSTKLMPLLNKSKSEVMGLRQEAHELGMVIQSDTIKQAERFVRKLKEWMFELKKLVVVHGSELIPVMQNELMPIMRDEIIPLIFDLLEYMADLIIAFGKLPDPIQKATMAFTAFSAVVGPILFMLGRFATLASGVAGAIGTLTTKLSSLSGVASSISLVESLGLVGLVFWLTKAIGKVKDLAWQTKMVQKDIKDMELSELKRYMKYLKDSRKEVARRQGKESPMYKGITASLEKAQNRYQKLTSKNINKTTKNEDKDTDSAQMKPVQMKLDKKYSNEILEYLQNLYKGYKLTRGYDSGLKTIKLTKGLWGTIFGGRGAYSLKSIIGEYQRMIKALKNPKKASGPYKKAATKLSQNKRTKLIARLSKRQQNLQRQRQKELTRLNKKFSRKRKKIKLSEYQYKLQMLNQEEEKIKQHYTDLGLSAKKYEKKMTQITKYYAKKRKKLRQKYTANNAIEKMLVTAGYKVQEAKSKFRSFHQSMVQGLTDAIIKGEKLTKVFKDLGKMIQRMLVKRGVKDIVNWAIGKPGGNSGVLGQLLNLGASAISGTAHNGGYVRPTGVQDIATYHSGGVVGMKPDERLIKAKLGEVVLNEEQQKALVNNSQGQPINVNVTAMDSQDVIRALTKDGGQAVAQALGQNIKKNGVARQIIQSDT